MAVTAGLLGIDLGQTRTKAVLFDLAGRELAVAVSSTEPDHPRPLWAERDLAQLRTTALRVVREALAARPDVEVLGVGVSGHSDGVYVVDEDGRGLRPAVLATDARARDLAGELAAGDRGKRLLELTGQLPMPSSPGPLVAWLRRHEPEVLDRARWLLSSTDWMRMVLTDGVCSDVTMASAGFVELGSRTWSPRVLELFGLADVEALLPPLVESWDTVGRVTAGVAAATGLPEGTPVVAGAHDVDTGAIGMGAGEGATSVLLGTYSINQVLLPHAVTDARWQVRPFVVPGQWLHMSTSPAGAGCLDWVASRIGPHGADGGPDVPAAVVEALGHGAAEHGPLFLPFVHGGPSVAPTGGSWLNLRSEHTRASMLASVLEGVAFGHRGHLEALAALLPVSGPLRVGGGGARSAGWTQLLCDAVGIPVEVTSCHEVSAWGAALLAGVGVGVFASVAEAATTVTVTRRQEPDAGAHALLSDRYERYREASRTLAELDWWPVDPQPVRSSTAASRWET